MDSKISVIITVYDKYDYLYCVLKTFEKQIFKNFEVLVAEDCEKPEMVENINRWRKEFSFFIDHVSQEDIGFRKNRILNKAIKKSTGNYIVVIDGDCMVHNKYLLNYQKYFNRGYEVIFGRRCEMSKEITEKILRLKGEYKIKLFELFKTKSKAWTECIYLPIILNFKKRKLRLLGSNMGFKRDTILKINGFNEDYEGAGIGEDSDLQWRFNSIDVKYKASKNELLQYHMYHERNGRMDSENGWSILKSNKEKKLWRTLNGIEKL
jgi:glycosyltransferase involved in cell wall biosynthesis